MKLSWLFLVALVLVSCAKNDQSENEAGPNSLNDGVYYAGSANSAPSLAPVLSGQVSSATSIELSWSDPDKRDTTKKYLLERKRGAGFERIAILNNSKRTYTDYTIKPGELTSFQVSTGNSKGVSPASNVVEVRTEPPVQPPARPTGLVVRFVDSSRIDLEWVDNSDNEQSFEVERRAANENSFKIAGSVGVNQKFFSDLNLKSETEYRYQVVAKNQGGKSAYSDFVVQRTSAVVSPPGAFSITSIPSKLVGETWGIVWASSKHASSYRLLVSRAADCSASIVDLTTVNPSAVLTQNFSAGNYYVCVFAFNTKSESRGASNNPVPVEVKNPEPIPPGDFSINSVASIAQNSGLFELGWSSSSNSLGFHVRVSRDKCVSYVEDQPNVSGNRASIKTDLPVGSYQICVYAKGANGKEYPAKNSPMSVSVIVPQPPKPGPFTINVLSSIVAGSDTLVTWSPSVNATYYEVIVAKDAACSKLVSQSNPTQTNILLNLANVEGLYYLCVSARDALGNKVSASNSPMAFQLVDQVPGAFSIAVSGPFKQGSPLNFSWSAAAKAAGYRLAISKSSSCNNPIQTRQATSAITSISLPALADMGTYFFCIYSRSVLGKEFPAQNGPLAFQILEDRPSAFAINPAGPFVQGQNLSVGWSASSASNYRIIVSKVQSCQSPIYDSRASASPITLSALTASGVYYLCVSAVNGVGKEFPATNSPLSFQVTALAVGSFSLNAAGPFKQGEPLTFAWTAGLNAADYVLSVSKSKTCSSPLGQVTVPATRGTVPVAVSQIPQGTYYACLLGRNSFGNAYAATNTGMAFTVVEWIPGGFSINAAGPFIQGKTLLFSWTSAPSPDGYPFKISKSKLCTNPLYETVVYGTNLTVSIGAQLTPAGTYYACVATRNPAGKEFPATNGPLAFQINEDIPRSFAISQIGQVKQNASFVAQWFQPEGRTFRVVLSKSTSCSAPLIDRNQNGNSISLTAPEKTGVYYLCVYAKNALNKEFGATNNPLLVQVIK